MGPVHESNNTTSAPDMTKPVSKAVKKTIQKKVSFKSKKGKVQFDAETPVPGTVQAGHVQLEQPVQRSMESQDPAYLYAFQ